MTGCNCGPCSILDKEKNIKPYDKQREHIKDRVMSNVRDEMHEESSKKREEQKNELERQQKEFKTYEGILKFGRYTSGATSIDETKDKCIRCSKSVDRRPHLYAFNTNPSQCLCMTCCDIVHDKSLEIAKSEIESNKKQKTK